MTKKIMTATAASSPAANSSDARQPADSIMPESTRLRAEPPTPLAAMTMPVTTPRWLWNQVAEHPGQGRRTDKIFADAVDQRAEKQRDGLRAVPSAT